MKQIVSIFLIVLALSCGLHNLLIQGFFNLNQARIAKTLCVEKDIKDSKCGGCCQLKKTLAEENTDEGTIPTEHKQPELVFQSLTKKLVFTSSKYIDGPSLLGPLGSSALRIGFRTSVYHPPDYIV